MNTTYDITLYRASELRAMRERWKSKYSWKSVIPFTRSEIEAELTRRQVPLEIDEDDDIAD
jgi:hypothetical protein